jgi:cysteinyl-tRNA synthetase
MHNEMLQVEGKKMSKSLGNFFTVRDLLDQGVPGEVIRFVYLSTHYRKPMDWTAEKAREAEATLRKWRALVAGVAPEEASPAVIEALSDDLNTAGAIAFLHDLARNGEAAVLKASAGLIGLLEDNLGAWASAGPDLSDLADRLTALRAEAMASKNFVPVDALKSALMAAGVEVRMSKAGVELELKNVDSIATAYARANHSRDDIDEANYWLEIAEEMKQGNLVCKENQAEILDAVRKAFLK